MKAKDMFNTIFQMNELTKDEFTSIIQSNPVEDDFISVMCALMDFFPDESSKHSFNNDFKKPCSICHGTGLGKINEISGIKDDCPNCRAS